MKADRNNYTDNLMRVEETKGKEKDGKWLGGTEEGREERKGKKAMEWREGNISRYLS